MFKVFLFICFYDCDSRKVLIVRTSMHQSRDVRIRECISLFCWNTKQFIERKSVFCSLDQGLLLIAVHILEEILLR